MKCVADTNTFLAVALNEPEKDGLIAATKGCALVAPAVRFGIYAYAAYFLQCALEIRCPLLTLDQGMKRIARSLDIKLVKQP